MELAFLVIAVIGLLALSSASGGGSVSGQVQYRPASGGPPQTWSPTPAQQFQAPMTPSTSAALEGSLLSGAAQIGTQANQQSVNNGDRSQTEGAAIGAGIGIAVSIVASLLAAHAARLKGATNENQAVDQYIPVFDSFVKQLETLWNNGTASAQQLATAAQQFDRYLQNAFRNLVGPPGTAWNDSSGMSGLCDKSCTVGCCVYYGDLAPVLNNISYVLGFPTGRWGQGDPRISGRTITVPKVYPSKYSQYSRGMYSITLN